MTAMSLKPIEGLVFLDWLYLRELIKLNKYWKTLLIYVLPSIAQVFDCETHVQ